MLSKGNTTHTRNLLKFLFREVAEMRGHDEEKLMLMKQEYGKYKDLWGLNLQYSHTAGPTKNYSELRTWDHSLLNIWKSIWPNFYQPRKRAWTCKWCTSSLTPQLLTAWKRMLRWPDNEFISFCALFRWLSWLKWAWLVALWDFSLDSPSLVASRSCTLRPSSFWRI